MPMWVKRSTGYARHSALPNYGGPTGIAPAWRSGTGVVIIADADAQYGRAVPGGAELHSHAVTVKVDAVDTHCDRARQHGARVVSLPADYPYGERQYTAEDLAGHRWTFTEAIADLAPEDWGGTSKQALGKA